jgi:hypothetical protein
MGEYFNWINLDKKEYISPGDFDIGYKGYESVYINNALLCALKELMGNEWKGSKIIFLGDEYDQSSINIPDMLNVILLDDKFEGNFIDYTYEYFKNVSCKFEAARNDVTEEISIFMERIRRGEKDLVNEYGVDINNPFVGMFGRKGKSYKYTINYSKGVAYCLDTTKIITLDDSVIDNIDPLPVLLGCGRTMQPGEWLGDSVGVSDSLDTGITLLDKIRILW